MKEMLIACAQATEDFGKRLDALDTYVAEAKKAVLFTIETRLSKIEFVYTIKGIGLCPKSTLFVRLYPQKNRPLCLHLYEIVRHDDFRCTYFPMIESGERMNACFAVLAGMVEEYLPAVEALALDETAYDAMLAEKRRVILRCANITCPPTLSWWTVFGRYGKPITSSLSRWPASPTTMVTPLFCRAIWKRQGNCTPNVC